MTLIPLNGHFQIQPVEQETFISSNKTAFEEIGIVVSKPNESEPYNQIPIGSRVFFDSWMATKFPDGKEGFYWLVPYESIRAYEKADQ